MIKRAILPVFLVLCMGYSPYSRPLPTILGYDIKETAKQTAIDWISAFVAGQCINYLSKPIIKGTEYIFDQPQSQKNNGIRPSSLRLSLKHYMPSVATALTALGAFKLASSTGYDHWTLKSLASVALGQHIGHLLLPRLTYERIDPRINFFNIPPSDPLYHWLNRRYTYSLSPSAKLMNMVGFSRGKIQRIDASFKEANSLNCIADLASGNIGTALSLAVYHIIQNAASTIALGLL